MELTKFNADAISKLIPPNAPKPIPLASAPPPSAAPPPATAFKILGLNAARPPTAEIKSGIPPPLIAAKARPIPPKRF